MKEHIRFFRTYMKRSVLSFYTVLFLCKGFTICTAGHTGICSMRSYLNTWQCTVIFCIVMMSAIIYRTFDTFITFFHGNALLCFVWCIVIFSDR